MNNSSDERKELVLEVEDIDFEEDTVPIDHGCINQLLVVLTVLEDGQRFMSDSNRDDGDGVDDGDDSPDGGVDSDDTVLEMDKGSRVIVT